MEVSIIVCTRNRSNKIANCLEAIKASLALSPSIKGEIIVVDNGSEDNTLTIIKRWSDTNHYPTKILVEPIKGLSRARNTGVQQSEGKLLVFTDDDCLMSKYYISNLIKLDSADQELVLRGGRVDLGDPSDLPLTIKTDSQMQFFNKINNSARSYNLGNAIMGCNMSMRKELFHIIGLFDMNLGPGTNVPGGEDTDFIFRAYLANIRIEYSPNIVVKHFHGRKSPQEGYNLLKNYMLGTGALYAKYIFREPNFCRQFFWDLKNSIKEIIKGDNAFLDNIGFSNKHKVYYSAVGFVYYLFTSLFKRT